MSKRIKVIESYEASDMEFGNHILKPKMNISEILAILGYASDKDDSYLNEIESTYESVYDRANIKYVYRQFPFDSGELSIPGLNFDYPDFRELFKDCNACILIALTLGLSIDEYIRKTQILDLAGALIVDACASSMIEFVADEVYSKLRSEYLISNIHFTERFSPGYGEVPIEINRPISQLLNTERRIGLKVADSGLMLPRKSIIAVWGLCDEPSKYTYDRCSDCRLRFECKLKESGEYCARKK